MLPPRTQMILGSVAIDAWETAKKVTNKTIKPQCSYCQRITGYVVGNADTEEERRFWTGIFSVAGWNYFKIENRIFIQITPCHVHAGLFDGLDGKPISDGNLSQQEVIEYRAQYAIGMAKRKKTLEERDKKLDTTEMRKRALSSFGL